MDNNTKLFEWLQMVIAAPIFKTRIISPADAAAAQFDTSIVKISDAENKHMTR